MQYFRPSFSYHLSLRSLFCLFLSGRLHRFLLYLCSYPNQLFLLLDLIHYQDLTFLTVYMYVGIRHPSFNTLVGVSSVGFPRGL